MDRLIATRETVGNVLMLTGPGLGGLFVGVLGLSPALMLATAATSLLAALTSHSGDARRDPPPDRSRATTLNRAGPRAAPAHLV